MDEIIKYIDGMILDTQNQSYNMYHGKGSATYKARMSAIVQIKKFINKQNKNEKGNN